MKASLTQERKLSPNSRKQRVPYRNNPKRNTPGHIVIKMAKIKDKEGILKAARERHQITYKGTPIRLSADVSAETPQPESSSMMYLK